MSKYSNEFKLLVAQRYENEIISYRDLAKQSGIDDYLVFTQETIDVNFFDSPASFFKA
ncbi:transposase [Lederbergia galactosidilytica]|uniref:transposase n=1 Tax=Lederbergia galactosidilytica TaxID=217031 RepID=UPI000A907267|nr:transposase [Lederbergia galactosidilytica]MBP1916621.1 transposase-like protein [Lederbergia galactosidilytica]